MLDFKDPAIKLFGKTISLPFNPHLSPTSPLPPPLSSTTSFPDDTSQGLQPPSQNQRPLEGQEFEGEEEDGASHQISEELKDPSTSPGVSEDPKTPSVDKETSSLKTSKDGEQSEMSVSQEKTLKKPDKILPCPRCNSMDTKFCYYNNYNVNQPRHFCKNCQRYWTAGGTMRNVPVGAGRRKNKSSSASHYRHIMVSEALQTPRASAANGIHLPTLGNNGTVLNFGSDGPLCESVASVLNLADKAQNCVRNGFHKPEQRIPASYGGGESGDDHSSITVTNSAEKGNIAGLQEAVVKNFQGFPPHVPCFPGASWSYPWNPAQWSSTIPPPAFCPPGFPISFYPAPTYWGCTVPGSWNMPCISPTSSPIHSALATNPNSPTLGKHSRDGEVLNRANSGKEDHQKQNNPERGVWIPKTLRIDDPNEAAKSSIWTTLGIKNDGSGNGGSLMKAFQSKGDEKKHIAEMSPVLQANPAALSRSLNFHERA